MGLQVEIIHLSVRKRGLCSSVVDMAVNSNAEAESLSEATTVKGV